MNPIDHRCIFITKEGWFQELFSRNIELQMEVHRWNTLEYQKVLKKMRYLDQERIKNLKEQIRNPTPERLELIDARTELFRLKELQKEIFKSQLGNIYGYKISMNQLNRNPNIFFPRTTRWREQNKTIEKRKIGLLTSIYKMEREICQLEFMRDISIRRNQLRNELLRLPINQTLPRADEPEIRYLWKRWLNSTNPKNSNGSNITSNITNQWATNLNNPNGISKKKFSQMQSMIKNNDINLSLRLKKGHLMLDKCKFFINIRDQGEK
jgi:hypothetical protein